MNPDSQSQFWESRDPAIYCWPLTLKVSADLEETDPTRWPTPRIYDQNSMIEWGGSEVETQIYMKNDLLSVRWRKLNQFWQQFLFH